MAWHCTSVNYQSARVYWGYTSAGKKNQGDELRMNIEGRNLPVPGRRFKKKLG
jgi:hypothetical protein